MTAPEAQLAAALADRYRIERELGRGGMATVYLAHDRRHDRPVALKVLHPDLANRLGPERFQREIRMVARLNHPHILSVHDSGESAGHLWFAMPYVEGESLRHKLERERQLGLDEAVRITSEVADALEYAHRHGIVHRDIKPENILLASGHALVADFGIARAEGAEQERLTGTGMVIGTPWYMSPEQASGERAVDGRTDQYALACVLYEMLAGEPPFSGPTAQAVMSRAFTETPRPLRAVRGTLPAALDQVVGKAMAKVPADRYASATEFARALARVPQIDAGGAGTSARRRWIPLAAVATLGLVLVVAAFLAWRAFRGPGKAGVETRLVAVLPFENQGTPDDEYFADGLTDEIRGKLAQVSGLSVIAGGSANQYKKSRKPPQQIASELGARYLLNGKVRWDKSGAAGSRVRVSPELILVSNGRPPTTVWQSPFDAALTDVFQVQTDIATQVAQALDVALGTADRRRMGERPTANLAAYDAWLKAEEARTHAEGNPAALRRAVQHYQEALALDSSFAGAWAGLSLVQSRLYINSRPDPALLDAARQAAERAAALAPDRPEPALALGWYHLAGSQAEEGYRGLRRALQSWPDHPELLAVLAQLGMSIGREEEALEQLSRGLRLDPRSPELLRRHAWCLVVLRRFDEAIAAADRAIAISPLNLFNYSSKAIAFLGQGNLQGARQVVRQIPAEIDPATRAAYFGTSWDLYWMLEDADQQVLLGVTPETFDGSRATWAIVMAQTWAVRGDSLRSRALADTARMELKGHTTGASGSAAQSQAFLGLMHAYLGRKAEAIAAGERAVELAPVAQDKFYGPYVLHLLARTYALVGEPGKAVEALERLLETPYFLSRAWLRIDPNFELLRPHPDFQRLIRGS